jgi:hypothetical protein
MYFFREKKREREREELWKRLHELADEIQKGDKQGTIGQSLQALGSSSQPGTDGNNPLNSTANQNNSPAATSAQSHSASAISTQMNSLSISTAAGSMSK